ncbi:DUF4190 domain-containing protein [Streptomyces sp. NPDC057877]|uniref:DUF4190 domain-containing protein n=1 Tax=Streptomyces sp. NPDC057877 TaxID=3346269 RepID=UPI0036A3B208
MSDDPRPSADGGTGEGGPAGDGAARVPLGKPGDTPPPRQDRDPWAPPADDLRPGPPPPSVHDQQTITSLPGEGAGYPPPPQQWTGPAHPFAPQPQQWTGPANPFAPPAQDSPVPPPPLAPGGPGAPGYGYGYGYPGGYGHPAPYPPGAHLGWHRPPPQTSNGMGTAGLVLGIVATVLFCLWPLAFILGLLGVVFGAIGRRKATRGEADNGGQALAGIICGAVAMVLAVGMGALVIFVP